MDRDERSRPLKEALRHNREVTTNPVVCRNLLADVYEGDLLAIQLTFAVHSGVPGSLENVATRAVCRCSDTEKRGFGAALRRIGFDDATAEQVLQVWADALDVELADLSEASDGAVDGEDVDGSEDRQARSQGFADVRPGRDQYNHYMGHCIAERRASFAWLCFAVAVSLFSVVSAYFHIAGVTSSAATDVVPRLAVGVPVTTLVGISIHQAAVRRRNAERYEEYALRLSQFKEFSDGLPHDDQVQLKLELGRMMFGTPPYRGDSSEP